MVAMQSIFYYQDYRKYLHNFYTECNLRNPKFSLRAFAAKLELNVSNIVRVMSGERNLSTSSLERVINYLKLREREAEYFTLLVKIQSVKKQYREAKPLWTGVAVQENEIKKSW